MQIYSFAVFPKLAGCSCCNSSAFQLLGSAVISAELAAVREFFRATSTPGSEAAKAVFLQSVRNDTVAGVPVVYGIPKGAASNTKPCDTKVALYLHGGGERRAHALARVSAPTLQTCNCYILHCAQNVKTDCSCQRSSCFLQLLWHVTLLCKPRLL